MGEELISPIPGQRRVQVSVSMQTGGSISLNLETVVDVGDGDAGGEKIRAATKELLDAIPVKEVGTIETALKGNEDDDIVTKEPHPTFLKLVTEISKLNKNLEARAKTTGS